MIRKTKKNLFIYLITLLSLASCLGQKGEKKADCALGQEFNAVSRTCQGAQRPPVGLLDDAVIYEDSGSNDIFITYSDPNGSEAVSCQVIYTRTNVWLRSGAWDSSALEASNAIASGNLAASAINAGFNPIESANAVSAMLSAIIASNEIPSSTTNPQRSSALRQTANYIRAAGQLAAGISGDPIANTRGLTAIAAGDTLDIFANAIDAACSCSGGICKTVAIPDRDWFGEVAFSYSVNDGQDNSSTEQATLRVISVNDVPIPVSQNVNFNESTTFAPVAVPFTVSFARDVEDDLFSGFFDYTVILDDPLKGTISDCMDKLGSTGTTDRTCNYTPINGDVSGLGVSASVLNFSGIDFTANAAGVHGNNISITIVENSVTRSGGVNGVGGAASVVIDVVGSAITITIETDIEVVGATTYNLHTIQEVIDALNADNYVQALVVVSLNGGAVGTNPATLQATTQLAGGLDAYDTITYRVNDGSDDAVVEGVISINITAVDDPPVAFTAPQALVEDAVQTITLAYTDAENQDALPGALGCTIAPASISTNIQLRSVCNCAGTPAVCSVDVVGLIDYNIAFAAGSLQYTINNGQLSNVAQVDFTITPVDDLPLPVYQNAIDKITGLDPAESPTALPFTYTFDLSPAYDVDSVVAPIYEIVTLPANGTISGCLNLAGSLGATDLECFYTPVDGNINDNNLHTIAATTINAVTYTAKFDGNVNGGLGKNITVEIVETIGVTPTQPLIYFDQAGTIAVPPTNLNVRILVAPNGTPTLASDIVTVFNAHPYAGQIITASTLVAATPQVTQVATPLIGGNNGIDYIDYKVTFAPGVSEIGRVNINMTPTNDIPVICQYSNFNDAPECGLLGCTANASPVGAIVPSKAGLHYYDSSRAICFVSKDIDSIPPLVNTDWEIVSSYVADQYVNEKDVIIVEGIKVDEGGGDTTEDSQLLRIKTNTLTSSNATLVPVSQIQILYNDVPLALPTLTVNFGDLVLSEDSQSFKIIVTPAALVAGTTTISFELEDITGGTVGLADGTAGATSLLVTFDVIVNPVSALHAGWENIRALGPKVNSVGAVLDMTEVCSYSRANCNGGESCSGTSDPLNAVVPDQIFSVFYNTTTKNCFYANGLLNTDWLPLKGLVLPDEVYCNITPSEYEPACVQGIGLGTCIGNDEPIAALVPTKENHFYWDRNNNTCYRSRDLTLNGLDNGDWEIYKSTGSSFLEWKPFTISGAGVLTGYNVFRRLPNTEYDYKNPINKNPIGVSVYKYTDNATNSWVAPIPKTVYFYEVRPIINNISTGTSEVFKDVRIMIPPANMSFAHRWIMNQSMCNTMNSTGIEASDNFRCPYVGPGNNTATLTVGDLTFVSKKKLAPTLSLDISIGVPGCAFAAGAVSITILANGVDDLASAIVASTQVGTCAPEIEAYVSGTDRAQGILALAEFFVSAPYYDIGQDLLVERFEAACSFTRSPSCNTPYGDCVADGSPQGVINSTLLTDIYYDRGTGDCYKSAGAGTANWALVTGTTVPFGHETPENPPLVNLTQTEARNICILAGNEVSNFLGYSNDPLETIKRNLPTKLQQAAFSQWDSKVNTNSVISILETGLSINSSPKCNSSSASGLAGTYSDTDVPDTNTMYSLPGTASSNIRSVVTGSIQTNLCVSRFDIQDVVGNVKEWVNARIDCDDTTPLLPANQLGLSTCISVQGPDSINHLAINSDSSTVYTDFKMDGIVGPCRDTNSDGECDSFLDKWLIEQERYSAGRWFVPIGLPVYTNFPSDNPVDDANAFMYEIGPTSGITSAQLHDDAMTINSHYLFATSNGIGAMATGGSYMSGQEAGVYSFEFLPFLNNSYGYITLGDVSIKSLNPLDPNITFTISDVVTPGDLINCLFADGGGALNDTVVIMRDSANPAHDANAIIDEINNNTSTLSNCVLEIQARLSGINQLQSQTLGAIDIIPSPATSTRNDVGFRCVLPVVNGDYTE